LLPPSGGADAAICIDIDRLCINHGNNSKPGSATAGDRARKSNQPTHSTALPLESDKRVRPKDVNSANWVPV
jgi:hypothetical protein